METARRSQFIWICATPALFALGALQFFRGELRRRTRDSRGVPHQRQVKAGVAHVPRALASPALFRFFICQQEQRSKRISLISSTECVTWMFTPRFHRQHTELIFVAVA